MGKYRYRLLIPKDATVQNKDFLVPFYSPASSGFSNNSILNRTLLTFVLTHPKFIEKMLKGLNAFPLAFSLSVNKYCHVCSDLY